MANEEASSHARHLASKQQFVAHAEAGDSWDLSSTSRNQVPSSWIRDYVLRPRRKQHPKGLRLNGANILGSLDLSFCSIPAPLSLQHCTFECPLDLHGAHIEGTLELTGSVFRMPKAAQKGTPTCIDCDRLHTSGSLGLNRITTEGPLRLHSAQVAGQLRLRSANLKGGLDAHGNRQSSLVGDRLHVLGTAFLDSEPIEDSETPPHRSVPFRALGRIRLPGALIEGNLQLENAFLDGGLDMHGKQLASVSADS